MNVILRLKTNDAGKFETGDYTTVISGHCVFEHPLFLEPAQCCKILPTSNTFLSAEKVGFPQEHYGHDIWVC